MPDRLYYLDNAATSFPKPDMVLKAVSETLKDIGANPGRGGHSLSLEADRILFEARERIAGFFNIPSSRNIVFSKNATESINLALKGLLKPGDHVVVSGMEHNAMMRPLLGMAKNGVKFTAIPCSTVGYLDPADVEAAIRPGTRLVALTHASNVTGTIFPIREIGKITRERNIHLLVDAAQTAGVVKIDVQEDGMDLLACTGHKGLLGPQGTGFLFIKEGVELEPLIEGGTGSLSGSMEQPHLLPDRFESGTQNTPGVAGLAAGIAFIEHIGLENIREREKALTRYLTEGLAELKNIKIHGPRDPEKQTAVLSFTIPGKDPGEVGDTLDRDYGVITRVGLHCSPMAHKTIGTYPEGTIRVSPGFSTREYEIDFFIKSVKEITA